MANPAQIEANQANAAHSNDPRADAGRDASSRNANTHGFTTGVFEVDAEDQPYYKELEASLVAPAKPPGRRPDGHIGTTGRTAPITSESRPSVGPRNPTP